MIEQNNLTLLSDVLPKHYNITLKLDLLRCTFDGFVNIEIEIRKTTSKIILNAEDLNIKNVNLTISDSKLKPDDVICEENDSKLIIQFSKELTSGSSGSLELDFNGIFEGEHFYNNIQIRDDGIPSLTAAIIFDSTGARRCFPCWDDPNYKATFNLTLVISQEFTALSNMPVISEIEQDNLKTVTFYTTPVMSTHSIAIVLGDFDFIETILESKTIRVYTQKNKSQLATFTLETIVEIITFYNNYFNFKYPLPKLDFITINFQLKTMDSWGLLIVSETCLLTDQKKQMRNIEKQSIRLNIGRKLVSQWIGALMTPSSSQDFWIYDGLTTFFQYMSVSDSYHKDGSVFEDFICNQLTKAFELDSQKTALPIIKDQETHKTIDEISRLKTPSLICMLQTLIGSESFRESIALFLSNHSYGTYNCENLWQFLEETSKQPIREIMSSWTKQAGYPVLKVHQRQEGSDRIVTISQKRFMADGSKDNTLWVIPVSIITKNNPHEILHKVIIPASQEVELVLGIEEGVWIAFHVGFYRVLYSENMINELIPAIEKRYLHDMHRFSILNDLFHSAKAGYISTKKVLELIPAYQHDRSCMVWNGIIHCLSQIGSLVSHLSIREEWAIFCIKLYTDIYDWIGWKEKKDESYLITQLRLLILQHMALLQDAYTIAEAERQFQFHLEEKLIPEYFRTCIYVGVVSSGKDFYLEKLLNIYFETESEEEKARVFFALGAVRNENMIKKVLTLTVSDNINPKYGKLVFQLMSLSHKSRDMAWNFVKENWLKFSRKYCGEYMSQIKKWVTQGFVTKIAADEVQTFLKNHEKFLDDPVHYFVEQIMINAKWLLRDKIDIERTLCFYVCE